MDGVSLEVRQARAWLLDLPPRFLFLNIYLLGCLGSQVQHMESSLHHVGRYMDSLVGVSGLSCPMA